MIRNIRYVTGEINQETMTNFANCLSDGYEAIKFEVSWGQRSDGNGKIDTVPLLIAILVKSDESD